MRSTAFPLHRGQDVSPNAQAAARHSLVRKGSYPAPADSLVNAPSSPNRLTPANEAALANFIPPDYNTSATTRTAQLFALAEQSDLQGLEAAFEGIPAGGSPVSRLNGAQPSLILSSSTPRIFSPVPNPPASGTAGVPDLANGRSSSSDLAAAAATIQQAGSTGDLVRAASLGTQSSVKRKASLRSLASSKSGADLRPRVDVLEADLIMVMTALCRLAGRRMAGSESDVYVAAGRHLASDILLKVCQFLLLLPPYTYEPLVCFMCVDSTMARIEDSEDMCAADAKIELQCELGLSMVILLLWQQPCISSTKHCHVPRDCRLWRAMAILGAVSQQGPG